MKVCTGAWMMAVTLTRCPGMMAVTLTRYLYDGRDVERSAAALRSAQDEEVREARAVHAEEGPRWKGWLVGWSSRILVVFCGGSGSHRMLAARNE